MIFLMRFIHTLILLSAIATASFAADAKILCNANTGAFIAEGNAHLAQETFSLTFNNFEVTATTRRCNKVIANVVTDDKIYLACEYDVRCVKDGKPVSEYLNINRLSGEFDSYQACIGYMTWGTCQRAVAKF